MFFIKYSYFANNDFDLKKICFLASSSIFGWGTTAGTALTLQLEIGRIIEATGMI